MTAIQVLIADDQAGVRDALMMIFDEVDGIEVLVEAVRAAARGSG